MDLWSTTTHHNTFPKHPKLYQYVHKTATGANFNLSQIVEYPDVFIESFTFCFCRWPSLLGCFQPAIANPLQFLFSCLQQSILLVKSQKPHTQYTSILLHVSVSVGTSALWLRGCEFDPPVAPLSCNTDKLSCVSSGVDKSSNSFGWSKGGNVTSAGWQVTLCDPV